MRKLLLIGAGLAVVGGGAAMAQMPPHGPNDDGPGDRGMGGRERMEMMGHMHHRDGGDDAARFRFKRGDMEIDIRCSDREPTQACVAGASALLDKLANAQPKTQ